MQQAGKPISMVRLLCILKEPQPQIQSTGGYTNALLFRLQHIFSEILKSCIDGSCIS